MLLLFVPLERGCLLGARMHVREELMPDNADF